MNLLKKYSLLRPSTCLRNCSAANHSTQNKIFYENLSAQRSLIRLSGNEVTEFLQGLITNDINHITAASPNDSIFTMFLNKQGRVLCDAIIFKCKNDNKTFFIECDGKIDGKLIKHLQLFRVRKKIDIDIVNNEYNLWILFSNKTQNNKADLKFSENSISTQDPRLNQLGFRCILPDNFNVENVVDSSCNVDLLPSSDSYNYRMHRYLFGVSEGIVEITSEKCFPFEANCDYLHGVSFHKGCYLGQEFTARTYHTGVIRKRHMPIAIEGNTNLTEIVYDAPILNESDQLMGKVKGIHGEYGIGALRIDAALKAKYLKILHFKASTYRPEWWPKQAT